MSEPQFDNNYVYRYLKLQVINLIVEGTGDILENITNFLFIEFTHFSSFWDEDRELAPIQELQLYDKKLDVFFSEDHDFYSKAFLFSLQHNLQCLRDDYSKKLQEIIGDDSALTLEIYEKLKLFFLK